VKINRVLGLVTSLALAYTISVLPGYSQQIITDGNTNTVLNTDGTRTNITTSTIKGKNAFNSFSKFKVNTGNTVNLILPDSTDNLLNLIYNESSHINGVLNSVKKRYQG